MKTCGEIEAAVMGGDEPLRAGSTWGAGRRTFRRILIDDLVLVRLQGVLTAAEQHLVKTMAAQKGRDLLKEVRTHLIETARPAMEAMIVEITGVKVLSLHL